MGALCVVINEVHVHLMLFKVVICCINKALVCAFLALQTVLIYVLIYLCVMYLFMQLFLLTLFISIIFYLSINSGIYP